MLSLVPGRPTVSLAPARTHRRRDRRERPGPGRGGHARPHHQRDRVPRPAIARRYTGRCQSNEAATSRTSRRCSCGPSYPSRRSDFFVRLLGLSEVAREDGTCYVRTWDDYERFTIAIVEADQPGIGITWLRAAGPEALARRVKIIEASGYGIGWTDGPQGIGPTYRFRDPDGHELGIYWESEWYDPPEGARPALKNQAAPFPGRGANVRRLDHVNYLAADVGSIAPVHARGSRGPG